MHRKLFFAIWSFVLINLLKDSSTIIQPVECFPEQQQQRLQRQRQREYSSNEKNAKNIDSANADIYPAALISTAKSRVATSAASSIFNVDPEQRRKLQEACEEIKCGAECYLAKDQGCAWSSVVMRCVFDEFEETDTLEFAKGSCVECSYANCGKECKDLEAKGCSWDEVFCTLDPTGVTDNSELEDGICSDIDPFINTIVFFPVIIISSLLGASCLIGFCVVIYCKMLQERNRTHVGLTLAAPNLTYYPTTERPIVMHTVQSQLVNGRPLQDEIAVAVVVDEPYQIAIQPRQEQNKTVDV